MKLNKFVFLVGWCVLSGLPAKASAASGAKALFHDEGSSFSAKAPAAPPAAQKNRPAPASQQPEYLGIAYWIELVGEDGKTIRTTTSRVFQSGDRIKLIVQPNRNGYLYVLGLGTTGTSRVLFPNSAATSNQVMARETYNVPFNTSMKFDSNPGEESLLVLLSPNQISELRPGQVNLPGPDTQRVQAYAQNQIQGSKDLVLAEEDGEASASPATYAVVPVSALGREGSLTLFIKLKHR